MTRMHRRIPLAAAALLGFALAACGTTDTTRASGSLLGGVTGQFRKAPAPPPLTRAALAGATTPLMLIEMETLGARAILGPLGSNGGVDSWASTEKQGFYFRQGVLVATRGLGPDLMSAAVPSQAQLASGSGSHARVHFYLDGLDRTLRQDYTCTLSVVGQETIAVVERGYSTRRVDENCSGPAGTFQNSYWFEPGGYLRQSRQYVAKEAGFMVTKRLVD